MSEPGQTSPYKIFISYRRDDTQDTVGHIYYRLKERFGADAIFMDVDGIPIGYDFASYINFVLRQCRVVLIVMGSNWPTVVEKDGTRVGRLRLNDQDDHVRIETEQALALSAVNAAGEPIGDLRLIPLLVQGAGMPRQDQLPVSLQRLTRFNGAQLQRYPHFDHDMQRLLTTIATWIGDTASSPLPPQQSSLSPQPAAPADPSAETLATFLPQLRAAFNEQDWPQVTRLAGYVQRNLSAERVPTEVYTMQGRALMAERDYAGAKAAWDMARQRNPLDAVAFRAAAEARIALGERAAALPLLNDALTLTSDRVQRLPLLRTYASVLTEVVHSENGAAATTHWNELLRAANEGLRLTGEGDASWLMTKLEALSGLGRDAEMLEIARTLTTLPSATAVHWLARARLAWKLAGESPTDEVQQSLDAAARLAPNDARIAQARQQWLVILKPDRFPPRLAQLGFIASKRGGNEHIRPPVCVVPAGEFLMGSDPHRDKEAQANEQPQHRVTLAAFSIGRFPVTVAEYACFVDAGQRQPQQWPTQMQKLDHPVVYVSWDDAVAYAAWLAARTGQPWQLPTEAEWEKAARWDPRTGVARRYPWGDTFDQSRANTSESGLRSTTAVGAYSSGASPYGADDMAGNVWEWTHSLYKPYPYSESDGREIENSTENRVLRGGSCVSLRQYARAACRYHLQPDNLYLDWGFRLAVAPGS